jgi:hypothetical protein
MTEKQQEAIAMLNEMYCSQSKDYQFQYKRNYFALVEFYHGRTEGNNASRVAVRACPCARL